MKNILTVSLALSLAFGAQVTTNAKLNVEKAAVNAKKDPAAEGL